MMKDVLNVLLASQTVLVLIYMFSTTDTPLLNHISSADDDTLTAQTDNITNHFPVPANTTSLGHQNQSLFVTNAPKHQLPSIGVGMAVTSKKNRILRWNNATVYDMLFFVVFMKSFCRTASNGFHYHFYLAFDYDDGYFNQVYFQKNITYGFRRHVDNYCPMSSTYNISLVRCKHHGKPAWAQNDAMMAAYMDGAEFFYRVNDDTILFTKGWTEAFIRTLRKYLPPYIGVVGPSHIGGNQAILTYDFVHRSHIEIFGFYYPRQYPSWYGDQWITKVYTPGRMTKLRKIFLRHTMKLGKRYRSRSVPSNKRYRQIESDKLTLLRYVKHVEEPPVSPDPEKVIAMVIWNDSPDWLWGVVRNAQLKPILFPEWTLRVYVASSFLQKVKYSQPLSEKYLVTDRFETSSVLTTLKRLSVDLRIIKDDILPDNVNESLLNLLAVDDINVTHVLLRHGDTLLSGRETDAVKGWLNSKSKHKIVHCIRDHPRHSNTSLVPGLVGINTIILRSFLHGTSIMDLLKSWTESSFTADSRLKLTEEHVYSRIWNILKNETLCHDSVSCNIWPNIVNFPHKRSNLEFVGTKYRDYLPFAEDMKQQFPSSCV